MLANPSVDSRAPPGRPTCSCLTCYAPAPSGIRLLAGVLSDPKSGARRRKAIRRSWMTWPGVGTQMIVCFALGKRQLSKRARASMSGEDVLWLDVDEIGVLSIPKVLAWWRAASRAAHLFTHTVKLDDDTFVHVPHLLAELTSASLAPYLCLGPIAYSGYNARTFRMCGWSWQRGVRNWKARGCEARQMVRPFPFPLGAMQLLSSRLAAAVGTSPEVAAFSIAANASADLRKRESNEDVALGYWIWWLSQQKRFNVTYVTINDRATNLGCFRNGGLYQQPRADAVVIHRIKGAQGMHYVWGMLHDGKQHDRLDCARAARIEVPPGSFLFDPKFAARVRSGDASVDFNPKTNMISMRFGRRPM
eukprot:CAMPEP_0174731992 /NCGR_PEP_ID=MMETSP1094-20130205/58568_1 /TAXON_ID=156173 /ORGANISM="Chrysochromulina brevifilum, Strain UTEX LB 985" /LENGTH=361 /DNA_ID=CAMNT_0015934445 /DNA_START=36 /DNA_END=1121 /DNA_ORIENTATION=-